MNSHTRAYFRSFMAERRQHPRASIEWQYLTRAARKMVWIIRGVPTEQWRHE